MPAGTPVTRVVVDSSLFTGPLTAPRLGRRPTPPPATPRRSPPPPSTAPGSAPAPGAQRPAGLDAGSALADALGAPGATVVLGEAPAGAGPWRRSSPRRSPGWSSRPCRCRTTCWPRRWPGRWRSPRAPGQLRGRRAGGHRGARRAGIDVTGVDAVRRQRPVPRRPGPPGVLTAVVARRRRGSLEGASGLLSGLPVAGYDGTLFDRGDAGRRAPGTSGPRPARCSGSRPRRHRGDRRRPAARLRRGRRRVRQRRRRRGRPRRRRRGPRRLRLPLNPDRARGAGPSAAYGEAMSSPPDGRLGPRRRTARRLISAGPRPARRGRRGRPRTARAAAVAVAHVEEITGLRPVPGGPVPGRRRRPARLGRGQRRRHGPPAQPAGRGADRAAAARPGRDRQAIGSRATGVQAGGLLAFLSCGSSGSSSSSAPAAGCCWSRPTWSRRSGSSASSRPTSGCGSACTR